MDTFIDGSTGDDELYNSPEYQVARSHFDDLDKIVVDYFILEIIEHSLEIIDEFANLLYCIYEDWTREERAYDIRKIWVWYWDEDYLYDKCGEWEDFLYEKYERGNIRLKDIDSACVRFPLFGQSPIGIIGAKESSPVDKTKYGG